MDEHVYFNWGKWKRINGFEDYGAWEKESKIPNDRIDNVLHSTVLSMLEYQYEAHELQGHESESRA
jgi:hypothetical protein